VKRIDAKAITNPATSIANNRMSEHQQLLDEACDSAIQQRAKFWSVFPKR
jgi:hypothetical protein